MQPGFKEAHLWHMQYSWIIFTQLHEGLQLRHFLRIHLSLLALNQTQPKKTLRWKNKEANKYYLHKNALGKSSWHNMHITYLLKREYVANQLFNATVQQMICN